MVLFYSFFDKDHVKSLYWICYNITSLLCLGSLAVRHVGPQLPDQGLNPRPPALEGELSTAGLWGSPLFYVISLSFVFLSAPCGLWDLSSLSRDRTQAQLQRKCPALTAGPPGNPLIYFLNLLLRKTIQQLMLVKKNILIHELFLV